MLSLVYVQQSVTMGHQSLGRRARARRMIADSKGIRIFIFIQSSRARQLLFHFFFIHDGGVCVLTVVSPPTFLDKSTSLFKHTAEGNHFEFIIVYQHVSVWSMLF